MNTKAAIILWIGVICFIIQTDIGTAAGIDSLPKEDNSNASSPKASKNHDGHFKTEDLCNGDPKHGESTAKGGSGSDSDESSVSFMASCETCISKVTVNGGTCYENTWTLKTLCQCDTTSFESCHCSRKLNAMDKISYIVLPIMAVFIIIMLQICMRHSKCQIAKMETELHTLVKKEAYIKRHGHRGTIMEDTEFNEHRQNKSKASVTKLKWNKKKEEAKEEKERIYDMFEEVYSAALRGEEAWTDSMRESARFRFRMMRR